MSRNTVQAWACDLSRRHFLRTSLTAAAGLALGGAGLLAGCAVNPVTGKSQFMLMGEDTEIKLDRQSSPLQISMDLGPVRDQDLNAYVSEVGMSLARVSYRPGMPYSFRVVNATYENAYAFPGGTIACTRGILAGLTTEAELAALLGHEIGHVNARHSAARASQGMVAQVLVGGAGALLGGGAAGQLVQSVGGLAAGALLASYSRDDERQADGLGMELMTRAGYSPQGMVQLMDFLNNLHKGKGESSSVLFATHPMAPERLDTAIEEAHGRYARFGGLPMHKERFMDRTASIRKIAPAIKAMQDGSALMAKKRYHEADAAYAHALKLAPSDYAGLLYMARCKAAQDRLGEAQRYAQEAKAAYPGEPQGYYVAGAIALTEKRYSPAYEELSAFDSKLPGVPMIGFMRGYCLEQMGRESEAAKLYYRYLENGGSGQPAQYAYSRLVQWGYIRPQR